MGRPMVGVIVTSLFLAALAQGQEAPGRGRRLTFGAGPLLISQRDENASPLRYGGAAPFLDLGYVTQTDRGRLALRLGGGFGVLGSALTGDSDFPRQETWRWGVEVEYARALTATDSRTRWFLGARIAGRGTAIQHLYAPDGNEGAYAFATVALGPVIALQRVTGARTTLDARLSTAVLALVGRPYGAFYADVHRIPDALHPRIATVDAFQSGDFEAAYTAEIRHRADIVLGYRLLVERYRDAERFRFAAQGVSVALALRLGRIR